MKSNKIILISWRVVLIAIFILSFGQPSSIAHAADVDLYIIYFNHDGGNFVPLETGRTYTIRVHNLGDVDSSGEVTLTNTLPDGLTATGISGTGWSCTLATLTCTRSDVLPTGEAYPDITVTVSVDVDAPASVINTATVSGGGDTEPDNNTVTTTTPIDAKPDLIITGYELVDTNGDPLLTDPNPNEEFGIRVIVKNQGGEGTAGTFYRSVYVNRNPMNPALFTLNQPGEEGCLYNIADEGSDWGDYRKEDFISGIPAGITDTETIVTIADPTLGTVGLPSGSYQIYLYADPNCTVDNESIEDNNSYGPINLTVTGSSSCTIPTGNPPVFADVPASHWAKDYIEAMYYCGYTAGCSTGSPLNYCPETVMSRAESSVFILRGNFGTTYTPPAPPWNSFNDDFSPGPWSQKWVQGLFNAGLTAGCNSAPLLFCPWDQTPRVQLAVFGVRLKYGSSFVPPPATGTVFADLTDPNYFGTKWAEQAYADGLIPACGSSGGKPLFCPDALVDRALAAFTVVEAKNLIP